MPKDQDHSQLVVVGSSAGGIDALSTLLSTLSEDFPAPIVIAQHLDPERLSHLQEILGRRTGMPVVSVANSERLKPGTVFVIPANRDVYISDHEVGVRAGGHARPKPSVDVLLNTAADVYGDRLIAVILTGTGTDGAAGARAVKRTGGTVVIQDPSTAPFPGMPLALAPNLVDVVATVDRMGDVLRKLLAGEFVPIEPDERRQLETFLDEVRERSGIDFRSYKTPTILRRLHRRVVATESGDLDTYIQFAASHPEEYQQLVNSFLIKVTEFFRDADLFAYLRDHVIPDLITHARENGNELRFWSAGCATGEEVYSLAILLCEALGPDLERMGVRIFGTDADPEAIAYARRGIYPASALAGVPEDLLTRYFSQEEGAYQIRKRVRGLTVFGQHDLGARAPFPQIDMVVCRNVLIYFTAELQQRTLQLFAYSLRNGGYLVLGKAESISSHSDHFDMENPMLKVFRREGDRILMPPTRFTNSLTPVPQQRNRRLSPPTGHTPMSLKLELQRARTLSENFLLHLSVGVVVVDRHYDIQSINGAARTFLSIHGPAVGEDLIHLVHRIPNEHLRAGIDRTFRIGEATMVGVVTTQDLAATTENHLQISCYPLVLEREEGLHDAVIVVINDVTSLVAELRETQRKLTETTETFREAQQATADSAIRQGEITTRLSGANQELVDANEDLTAINQELRASNEELMLSAEEAQAATEEVETLNEELQATNEELETLNEELQSTIEELNTTNDDLAARTSELQALARTNGDERARLKGILASMGDAVLVVDAAGNRVLTNSAYDQIVWNFPDEMQLRDVDGNPLPADATPQRRAARGETFSMEFTLQMPDRTRRWFEANGQPVRTADSDTQGEVVVIRDITDRSLHRLQEEFLGRVSHELRTPLTSLQLLLQRLDRQLKQEGVDPKTGRYAEAAFEQAKRFGRLVGDLLDVSALQSGKYTMRLERISFGDVIAKAVEMSQVLADGWTIELEQPDEPVWVHGDADRLQQVVLNLIHNALAHAATTPRLTLRVSQDGRTVELQVQDYGPGISETDLRNIFSQFFTVEDKQSRARGGLGLGLYISREIAVAHGGTLSASSVVGQGATFILRLPIAPSAEGSDVGARK